jgi:hypothetical protein
VGWFEKKFDFFLGKSAFWEKVRFFVDNVSIIIFQSFRFFEKKVRFYAMNFEYKS